MIRPFLRTAPMSLRRNEKAQNDTNCPLLESRARVIKDTRAYIVDNKCPHKRESV